MHPSFFFFAEFWKKCAWSIHIYTVNHFTAQSISSLRKAELANKIVKWIVRDSRPIYIISDEGLKDVLREAIGSGLNNHPFRDILTRQIERSKLLDKLKYTEYVGLTGDFWTSIVNQSYLGISTHWVVQTGSSAKQHCK